MKKIRILVAEDFIDARESIVNALKKYELKRYENNESFKIEEAESFIQAKQILTESEKNKEPFDVFFCDLDFTEDEEGGERDSGFELIRLAFKICSITNIYTYSSQFNKPDLYGGHEELVSKGFVIKTFDKSHSEGGDPDWFNKNFAQLFTKLEKERYLNEIWANHELIKEKVRRINFSSDIKTSKFTTYEIIDNLNTILYLMRNRDKLQADKVIYKLIIQLYHRCLESFCLRDKDDSQIMSESEKNKVGLAKSLGKKSDWKLGDKVNALRTIAAHTDKNYSKFGYKVNFYRNNSVHPADDFAVGFCNVLFCNLALAVYANDGSASGISFEEIRSIASKQKNDKGIKDLEELFNYLK